MTSDFAIHVGLPMLAFIVHAPKDSFGELIDEMNKELDEDDVEEASQTRAFLIINDAIDVAEDCIDNKIDYDYSIKHIAMSFVYAFAATYGKEALDKGIGLSVMADDEGIVMELCTNQDEIDQARAELDELIESIDMVPSEKVTIH